MLKFPILGSMSLVFVISLAACSAAAAPTPTAPAAAAASSNVVVPKPANASLKITSPKAADVLAAGDVKVTIDYTGPDLVPAAQAKKVDDFHVHYLLDVDATSYLGTTSPLPTGNPHVIHSAAKEVTVTGVTAGSHTLTVIMTGSNHISVNSPVWDKVAFTVN